MADCTPNFIPSSTRCVMPSTNESKSRLEIGGSFFKSKILGTSANDISIESIWFVCSGSPPTTTCPLLDSTIRPYDSNIDSYCDTVAFELIVYNNNVEVERWRIAQSVFCGSPITWTSGIPTLRSTLAASSSYVNMPASDSPTGWFSADDGTHLIEFPQTNLSGAIGPSNNPTQSWLDAIRTGPAFTLVNISYSEINNDTGVMDSLNEPRYWNGNCWKVFNSINPEVACDSDPSCP